MQAGLDGDSDTGRYFVDQLRSRIDKVKDTDTQLKEFAKEEKVKTKNAKGIELFMGE